MTTKTMSYFDKDKKVEDQETVGPSFQHFSFSFEINRLY